MIRKVKLPIKFKLMAIVNAILISSMVVYIIFALDLFKKDKAAYVFETGLSSVEHIKDQVGFVFDNVVGLMVVMNEIHKKVKERDVLQRAFEAQNSLFEFSIYPLMGNDEQGEEGNIGQIADRSLQLLHSRILSDQQLDDKKWNQLMAEIPLPIQEIRSARITLKNYVHVKEFPHWLIGIFNEHKREIYVGRIVLKEMADLFAKNLYEIYAIDPKGELYLHKDLNKALERENLLQERYLQQVLLQQGPNSFVKEVIKNNGEKLLLATSKVDRFNLNIVAEYPREKAFLAANYLVKKSVFFGLFIVSMSMIIAILFSRSLSTPIEQLFEATVKIAKGDFSERVRISGHDEIGALADSFNYMGGEIVRYMEEMKEKVRIEGELKVAQLVQSSFFPASELAFPWMELAAYYTPATECGGDWWGHIHQDGKFILVIADATGHGVPAALLTGMIHCCLTNIRQLGRIQPEVLGSPARILQLMNEALRSVGQEGHGGQEMTMSCFVAILDVNSLVLKYSNASHNPPLHYVRTQHPPQKSDFHPLLRALGPRLGHKEAPEFTEEEVRINKGDGLIFFTDGLIDCCDQEGKGWGQRRFLKSLMENANRPPAKARENILDELREFQGNAPTHDDMTLILARIL